jgi:SOS-response transcriptional repressor LexA
MHFIFSFTIMMDIKVLYITIICFFASQCEQKQTKKGQIDNKKDSLELSTKNFIHHLVKALDRKDTIQVKKMSTEQGYPFIKHMGFDQAKKLFSETITKAKIRKFDTKRRRIEIGWDLDSQYPIITIFVKDGYNNTFFDEFPMVK